MDEKIEERKKKIKEILTKKKNWLIYLALLVLLYINVWIRTRNMWGLKDVTTGQWTLGPDLDPFLFLRWGRYIVEHGSLMVNDMMRYVPLGFKTVVELKGMPYSIAYFSKILSFFGNSDVTYAAVILPVFFSVLMCIAFFLLVRRIFSTFYKENYAPDIIALIATFFLITLPSLLPRTIAGIPEKESFGFFLLFLILYLFIAAWQNKNVKGALVLGILSGLATFLLANTWGGVIFVYFIIAVPVLISFIFGAVNKNNFVAYSSWSLCLVVLFIVSNISRGLGSDIIGLFTSSSTATMLGVLGFMIVDQIISKTRIKDNAAIQKLEKKIPRPVVSIIATLVIGIILLSILLGPGFSYNFASELVGKLTTPYVDRLSFTIAENRQPYFSDWSSEFGPSSITLGGRSISIPPLFFWLLFFGSIFLFYETIKKIEKRERWILVSAYFIFLVGIIFSRNSPSAFFNGTNFASLLLYFGSIILFLVAFAYVYFKYYKENKISLFKNIEFGYLFVFIFFFLAIVAARSAIRLLMVLAPIAAIIISFFLVYSIAKAIKNKGEWRVLLIIAAIVILILTTYTLYFNYNVSKNSAQGFVPSIYTQQWQKAMSWVRDNTPENAVFGHWWDYGYWLQSIGNRATVLDGGNAVPYWDHLMGRLALTGLSEEESLDFLYTHNTTHFLIDSTDIGKYGAFSSIGSNENYDRRAWIPTLFVMDAGTRETKDSIIYQYAIPSGNNQVGVIPLDDDLIWKSNESEIFLPAGAAGIISILVEMRGNKPISAQGVFIYSQKQYALPLKYVYYNGTRYVFNGASVDSGLFIMPRLVSQANGVSINPIGAAFYLSKRTGNSNLARLYLFGESKNFKLVHTESHPIVENIRQSGGQIGEFVYYNDFYGPIKIWEIKYPKSTHLNEEYLKKSYPNQDLAAA